MDKVEYKKIFSKRVFLQLVIKGHLLLWTEQNRKVKWLSVFVFKIDDTILADLTEITDKNKTK